MVAGWGRIFDGMTDRGVDRYGADVLAKGSKASHKRTLRDHQKVEARRGLVVEDVASGWCGAVTRVEKIGGQVVVALEDRRGRSRSFPLGHGFWVDGKPVELVRAVPSRGGVVSGRRPAGASPAASSGGAGSGGVLRSASGSRAVVGARARVAQASRIWVEGKHDAELVEKIWGHDLRLEGVVVEPLHGLDDLAGAVAEFGPGPSRKLGVLVDHLVAGSKEARIAEETMRKVPGSEHVLIVGHPYVDVWQAVKPGRVGLKSWPQIPRSRPWKEGILDHLGLPYDCPADIAEGWQKILARVRHYADLEPQLLGRVEHLIDHVTAADDHDGDQ